MQASHHMYKIDLAQTCALHPLYPIKHDNMSCESTALFARGWPKYGARIAVGAFHEAYTIPALANISALSTFHELRLLSTLPLYRQARLDMKPTY